jgi:hypothetical protein
MTRTLQEMFFANLDLWLTAHGCEAAVSYRASNTGTVDIVPAGQLTEPLISFRFHFQDGHNVFESKSPLWADGAKNPNMCIAHDAGELGRALDRIVLGISARIQELGLVLPAVEGDSHVRR